MQILRRELNTRASALIAFEAALIVLAVEIAAYARLTDDAWAQIGPLGVLDKALFVGFVTQLCLYYADLYELRVVADRRELLVRLLQALGAAALLLGIIYFWAPQLIIGR